MTYSFDPTSTALSLGIDKKRLYISSAEASMLPFPDFKANVSSSLLNGVMENSTSSRPEKIPCEVCSIPKRSTARALLKYAGTWAGDDLEQCLREVYATRGEAKF